MSVNFFDKKYSEPARTNEKFGICDDQDNTKAYTNIDNPEKWIATILNENRINIRFIPIDNNIVILKENTQDKESTCDGMIRFSDRLYLVELKDQDKNWRTKAIDQLKSTIVLLKANHDLTTIKHKKAFACNKRHPRFQEIDNEENLRFYRQYGFRLDIQAEIQI